MDEGRASDRLLAVGVAGATLWMLSWLVVQLHGTLGWALPSITIWR